MGDLLQKASQRLSQTKDFLTGKMAMTLPWDPDSLHFPLRKDLPKIRGAPEDAAWVWGEDDNIGRLNLLTPSRVKAAASEIQTGEMIRLDLPLDVPKQPAFGREVFKHSIKALAEGVAYDDTYHMNTQSGTQWDGFRHIAHMPTQTFYNGCKATDFTGPKNNPEKCSIHHWSKHGFSGRGVLLDYRSYASSQGITYDSATPHSISYAELEACGKAQGVDIRPISKGGDIKIGDVLFIRSGYVEDYYKRLAEENQKLGLRAPEGQMWAGVKQEEAMIDWLHDCYFTAVAGDAPAFEVWPTKESYHLHEYLLALWGMPIGEMLDLEKLSQKCKEKQRYFFFFSSSPANCPGGVSSHVNGTAIL